MTSEDLLFALMIVCVPLAAGVLAACTERIPLGRLNRRWFFTTYFGGVMLAGLSWWALNAIVASRFHPALAWALAVPLLLVLVVGFALWCGSLFLRIHDLNLAGGYFLVLAIPFVQFLFMGALFLWPGAKEPNRYGVRNRYLQRHVVEHEAVAAV